MGGYLRAIHRIPIAGFGHLKLRDGTNAGRFPSWWAYVREEGRERLTKLPPSLLSPEIVAFIERRLRQTGAERELERATLLHGDYQLKNVLVQKGQVTGILDFENLLAGDPVFDFCALHYWSRDPATTAHHLLRGYGRSPSEEAFMRRLYLYELLLALEILWWENHLQNRAGLRSALARLAHIVAVLGPL